jgi:hypothetical protein
VSYLQESAQVFTKSSVRARTSLRADPHLLEEFQERVREVFGKLKGTQELALNDAIKLWLELSHGAGGSGSILFGYVETAKFRGYRALYVDEFATMMDSINEASMVAVNGSLHSVIIKKLLMLKPDRVVLREREGTISAINEGKDLPLEEEISRKAMCGTVYMFWDKTKAVAELESNSLKFLKRPAHYELANKLLN